jgi:hypothetical protein
MVFPILLFWLLSLPLQTTLDLEKTVALFWDCLAKGDKIAALEHVHADSRNAFVNRTHLPVKSWKLLQVEAVSGEEATVTVSLERLVPERMTFVEIKVREQWVREGEAWKLQLRQPEKVQSGPMTHRSEQKPKAGVVDVYPASLRIVFLTPKQEAGFFIRNGLSVPVEIARIDYDREKFELTGALHEVPPESIIPLTIKYVGNETAKNLTAELVVALKCREEEQLFTIPLVYNYLSPSTRALLGLTPEQAEKLRRGDKVRPALKLPQVDERGRVEKDQPEPEEQSPE